MKVERLLVLVLLHSEHRTTEDDDIRDGVALAVKHVKWQAPKADDQALKNWEAFANGTPRKVAGCESGQIGKHNACVVFCAKGKVTSGAPSQQFFGDAKTCGVYVICHGSGGMTTPYVDSVASQSPQAIAALILSLIPDKIALKKVNLVSCTLAAPLGNEGDKDTRKLYKEFIDKQRHVETFTAMLCDSLDRKETMVAGYTVPVYVVRDNNPEFTTFGVDGDDRPKGSTIGQKAAKLPGPGQKEDQATTRKILSDNRAVAKIVYQRDGSKVKTVSIDQYHLY